MLSRTALRRLPQLSVAKRYSSSNAGSVAQSREFKNREQGQEGKYVHQKEMEQLEKIKAALEAQRQHLDTLSGEVEQKLAEQTKKNQK